MFLSLTHRARNVKKYHGVVRGDLGPVSRPEWRGHDLLGVAFGGVLQVAGIVCGEVQRLSCDVSRHVRELR